MNAKRDLSWREANRVQLCEIAYNDEGAPLKYRLAAAEELKRRARQKHGRINYKAKAMYPR